MQEGEALTAEFRLGTFDPDASDLDRVHHDTAAAPADAKYVSQARARGSCKVCEQFAQRMHSTAWSLVLWLGRLASSLVLESSLAAHGALAVCVAHMCCVMHGNAGQPAA